MMQSVYDLPLIPLGLSVGIRDDALCQDIEAAVTRFREEWPAFADASNLAMARFSDDGNPLSDNSVFLPRKFDQTFVGGPLIHERRRTAVFQLRDERPTWNPGRIGMFGGSALSGEGIMEALQREYRQELNLDLDLNHLRPLYLEGCLIRGTLVLRVVIGTLLDHFPVVVNEGLGALLISQARLEDASSIILPRSWHDTQLMFRKLRAVA